MTIAILEDDDTLREGLRDLFLSAGYSVRAAGLLRDAERIAEAELWLVDLMLPDGSGLEFVRGLRAAGDVPVIILTALDDEESIIRGLRAGVRGSLLPAHQIPASRHRNPELPYRYTLMSYSDIHGR